MNVNYTKKISDEEIKIILLSCGLWIDENAKDKDGNVLNPIQRNENSDKILIRCVKPTKNKEDYQEICKMIASTKPELVKKLMLTTAFLNTFVENNAEKDIIIIENFCAYFPFEEDVKILQTQELNQAYVHFCFDKFKDEYKNSYVEYYNKLLSNDEMEK